jgi:hypothetical protein
MQVGSKIHTHKVAVEKATRDAHENYLFDPNMQSPYSA